MVFPYHLKVRPTQNRGVPLFSCLGYGAFGKGKVFSWKLKPAKLSWHSTLAWKWLCVSDDVYTLFNIFIEIFCLQPSRYLRLSMVQQSLLRLPRIRSRWFLFIRSEIYLLSTHKKCNRKTNHTYLNLVNSICHRVDIYRLVKLLTPPFCYYF